MALLEELNRSLDVLRNLSARVVDLQEELLQLLLPEVCRVEELLLPRVVEEVVHPHCSDSHLPPDEAPDAVPLHLGALLEEGKQVLARGKLLLGELL